MTITKIRTYGFHQDEIVTHQDLTQLDENAARGLDKEEGQTDILASDVTVTGLLDISGDINIKSGSNFTVNTGATAVVTWGTNADVSYASGSTLTVNSGCVVSANVGSSSTINLSGLLDVKSGGIHNVSSGGLLDLDSGAVMQIANGATVSAAFGSTSELVFNSGSAAVFNSGSLFTSLTDMQLGAGKSFALEDGTTKIQYATPVTRTRKQGIMGCYSTYDGSNTDPPGFSGNAGGFRPVSGSLGYYLVSTAIADELVVPILNPINGATLKTVRLYYKPRAVATPDVRMTFDVRLIILSDPTSNASLMSGGGHTSGSPGEVGSYVSTVWTSKVATMNQYNVIDTSSYAYVVRIKEEQGSGTAPGTGVSGLEFVYDVTDLTAAI